MKHHGDGMELNWLKKTPDTATCPGFDLKKKYRQNKKGDFLLEVNGILSCTIFLSGKLCARVVLTDSFQLKRLT